MPLRRPRACPFALIPARDDNAIVHRFTTCFRSHELGHVAGWPILVSYPFFLAFDRRREVKILETRQRHMGFHS